MRDNFVAMQHELCPCCLIKVEGSEVILIETRMQDISKRDRQPSGISLELCTECRKTADDNDGVWIVEVDEHLTEEKDNPYRTGNIVMVRAEEMKRLLVPGEMADKVLSLRWAYMPKETTKATGIDRAWKTPK